MTQAALARLLGVSSVAVHSWVHGKKLPSPPMFYQIHARLLTRIDRVAIYDAWVHAMLGGTRERWGQTFSRALKYGRWNDAPDVP